MVEVDWLFMAEDEEEEDSTGDSAIVGVNKAGLDLLSSSFIFILSVKREWKLLMLGLFGR